MLWGTSSLALYIPWAGRGGPYLGTTLWLWLGVLDAVQGVGLGMILLQVRFIHLVTVINSNLATDAFPFACLRHACILSSDRMYLCHGSTSDCSKQHRPGKRVPRRSEMGLLQWFERQSNGFSSILGRYDISDRGCR